MSEKQKDEEDDGDSEDTLKLYMVTHMDLSELGLGRHTWDYDPDKKSEAQAVESEKKALRKLAASRTLADATITTGASEKLSDLFALFCADKRTSNAWKHPDTAEKYDYGPHIRAFIAAVGDKPIATLTAEDARKFRAAVLEKKSEAKGNKDKRFNRVKAFLNWAREQHHTDKDFSGILKLESTGTVNRSYEPFTADDLKKLFHSRQYQAGTFKKAYQYWLPLLGLYTGGRLNELAQLYVADIKKVEDIDAIDINDDGDQKSIKNESSKRTVPIHPALRKTGFLEYVELLRKEGHSRLFPELKKSNRPKDSFGKEPSRDFTRYRRALGVVTDSEAFDVASAKWVGRGRKVFHSFRTTANSMLRRNDVPQERRERLVGHESEGTNNKVYKPADKNELFSFQTLYDDLCKLDYGLTHRPYRANENHRRGRLKNEVKK